MSSVREDIRNIAIVAHVDHGKTTLVDTLLEEELETQLGKDDRLMDGNDQEKERGITILAKNAAINYKGIKVNIVDTPGHADFGGEVERVLGMVDGVLLVVDAQEGPKPQTRFVLKKALENGLRIIVVMNKIDKPASRPDYVNDKTFDLFCELGADDDQCDFKVVYTSAINRLSGMSPDTLQNDMNVLKDAILELPKPVASVDEPLQLQISNVGSDPFIGRLGVGRIKSGTLKPGVQLGLSSGPGTETKTVKLSKIFTYDAMGKKEADEASAGDIVVFAGISEFDIGDTIVDLKDPRPLEPIAVEKPTMAIRVGVNKSPFSGKSSAKFLTGNQIKDRLRKEVETNVALKVEPIEGDDALQVYGRGLLHLTVLLETMRREASK
jgi:GTP-binding protein